MDESREARAALRYAAQRAARTGGAIELLAIMEPPEFVQWGGVQAAMEEEARLRAEAMVLQASSAIAADAGLTPAITIRQGEPAKAIAEYLKERDGISALVLGAVGEGSPGPLVSHFAGNAGTLPCPLIIVPGTLSDEALDALS
jgi:nucleotide-binding universal stress UspA family protein